MAVRSDQVVLDGVQGKIDPRAAHVGSQETCARQRGGIEVRVGEIGLAEIARVVNGAYDVANWLEHPALDWPRQFVTPRGLLVWRTGDKVAVRELPAFSALVMQEIQQRTTIAALVRLVLQASSVTDNLRIQQLVTDQVQAAYAAGLIRLDPSNDHATMNVRSTAQTEPERSTLV